MGKVHERSLNLLGRYKIIPQPQNRTSGVPHLTKPVTKGPSAVLTPVLSHVAADSAWDPCGPHMSVSHVITSLYLSSPFLSLFLSLTYLLSAGWAAGGDVAGVRRERRSDDRRPATRRRRHRKRGGRRQPSVVAAANRQARDGWREGRRRRVVVDEAEEDGVDISPSLSHRGRSWARVAAVEGVAASVLERRHGVAVIAAFLPSCGHRQADADAFLLPRHHRPADELAGLPAPPLAARVASARPPRSPAAPPRRRARKGS